ncbi:signal recognition particle, SRP9/SRP14 subunit [Hygrophoropsis aurantiaca]|uniref:Signal recognition particle, SRP9/SRP14 subunit n=1 Tax=Hygrophoropsis aurantiaca TaxID=72124 RepID=A0ACB8AH61_9AGAM|nr:signal recognition particle, SRP9/SRP14 subunit [Hygrophoropsis aurantiaca]
MVYITSWQEYQEAAEALYTKSPTTARYCVKWRASEGKLVLKITDNTTCLKFKTYSSIFLNRFEALNLSLMQKMQNKRPEPPQLPKTEPTADATRSGTPSSVVPQPTGPAAGGIKKKKPKKKK